MTTKVNQQINLRDALDTHINARSVSKSISTLMQGKRKTIDYTPYYQRNYVWDRDKGTFFIESILLGIEIPPLIMFIPTNDKRKYEVIDGRQRYETLLAPFPLHEVSASQHKPHQQKHGFSLLGLKLH